jgi:DNA-binding LacI/PurR family transcriptional regulator
MTRYVQRTSVQGVPHDHRRTWCDPWIAPNSRSSRPVSGAPSSKSRKVTSVDVAKRAGVSQTTVSLVFSGKGDGRVSSTTQDAVRRAARELGYRPNAAARALRSGTASAVGLVVRDVTHPFFGRTLRGAQQAAREAGHVVVLIDDNYGVQGRDSSVEALSEGTIDGFLFFAAKVPRALREPGSRPVVIVEYEQPRIPFVRLDGEGGADAALAHLHALGHRAIGYLRASARGQTFDRRQARWAAHLTAIGEDPDAMVTGDAGFEATSSIAAARTMLQHPDRPSAFMADDDLLAAGLVAAAHELGLRVPEDVAVVGFDDLDLARLTTPPLTTVRFDAEALGAAAFGLLHARLQGQRPKNIVLPSELVVRGSTTRG